MHIKYIYNMSVAATSDKETKQEKLFEHLQVHRFPAAGELPQGLGQHVAHFNPKKKKEWKKKKKKKSTIHYQICTFITIIDYNSHRHTKKVCSSAWV